MLDVETKRRIDTARDILVGKVPDPKSQVEQITIALIYKFMDDMDAEAEELGGERTFFKGEFERYGWTKLMAPNMGGFDVISLYSESIQKMNENPDIPQLFRDIFKNAYLPYRDPETLKSFLKIINAFSYDHSERLGDAFEYLLSVLGSQGEAGQFRTPRHIIDFMVEVIEPKKNESILDPACGTAGFLISSYKHIRKHNSSNFRPESDREAFDEKGVSIEELTLDSPKNYRGDLLMPDDRARLSGNIRGLDISPDMVRLSLVNMYLHGFTEPHIYEYDTLTSEERWNEFYDVILANPPFMSPKGGIKPHKRFSIQSNRSEVLFVDYIAEHITPTGRAAVIVPEGIIFQSGTAYKQLRKMLVDKYLFAVVSLPAGVFNPYSGVKTSILFMDRLLAKKTDKILFVKIENDGFGLGAQRRPINKNDLPQALKAIKDYRANMANGEVFEVEKWANALVVQKEKIAGNGDYYLNGERYRESDQRSSQYPHVELGEVVDILDYLRRPITKHDRKPGPYPYYGATGVLDHVDGYLFDEPLVLVGEDGAKWEAGEQSAFPVEGKVWVNNHAHVLRPKRDRLLDRFLIEILNEADLMPHITGVTVPKLNQEKLRSIQIPLPPLEVQKEIVAEIEGYQKVINGARAVLDNYRPHIPIHPDWPMVELEEICEVRSGGTPSRSEDSYWNGSIPWVGSTVCKDGEVTKAEEFITEVGLNNSAAKLFPKDTTLIALVGATIGKTGLLKFESTTNQNIAGVYPKSREVLEPVYLFHAAQQLYSEFMKLGEGKFRMANLSFVREQKIPLPPLAAQQAIVAEIESEQALVAANRELIERFEKKIQATLARVWGEEEKPAVEAE